MQIKKWAIFPISIILVSCQETNTRPAINKAIPASPKSDTVAAVDKKEEQAPVPDHSALGWEELKQYLPEVKGFIRPAKASGENSFRGKSSNALYYSYARQIYKKGNSELWVEIIDYNNDPKTYQGLLSMYGFSTTINNEQFSTRPVDLKMNLVKALETTYKTEQKIRLTLAVNDRFIITIQQSGSPDAQLLERVASAIRLEEMITRYGHGNLAATH